MKPNLATSPLISNTQGALSVYNGGTLLQSTSKACFPRPRHSAEVGEDTLGRGPVSCLAPFPRPRQYAKVGEDDPRPKQYAKVGEGTLGTEPQSCHAIHPRPWQGAKVGEGTPGIRPASCLLRTGVAISPLMPAKPKAGLPFPKHIAQDNDEEDILCIPLALDVMSGPNAPMAKALTRCGWHV